MSKQPSSQPDLPHAPFIWRDVRILREMWPVYVPNWLIARSKDPAALAVGLDYVLYDADLAGTMFFYGTAQDVDEALGSDLRTWLSNIAYMREAGQSLSAHLGAVRGLSLTVILSRIYGRHE